MAHGPALSLRALIIRATLIGFGVAFLIAAFGFFVVAQLALDNAKRTADIIASGLVDDISSNIEEAFGRLDHAALDPDIVTGSPEVCHAAVQLMFPKIGDFLGAYRANQLNRIDCSTLNGLGPGGGFVVSRSPMGYEEVWGRDVRFATLLDKAEITGTAVLILVRNFASGPSGPFALSVTMSMNRFGERAVTRKLQAGSVITLVNAEQRLISRYPNLPEFVGKDVSQLPIQETPKGQIARSLDGRWRVYGSAALPYGAGHILIALPLSVVLGDLVNSMALLGLAVASALIAAWLISVRHIRKFILPDLKQIETKAQALATPTNSYLPIPALSIAELDLLAQNINRAASTLAEHQSRLTRLSLVAQRSTNLVLITDAARCIEWANDSFIKRTGYSLDDIIGRNPGDFLQGPGTDRKVVDAIRQALSGGEAIEGAVLLNFTKAGKPYWARLDISPLFDTKGKIDGFVSIQTDVTKEKEELERIRIAQSIFEKTVDGILVCNGDLLIEWSNQAFSRIVTMPLESLTGRQFPAHALPIMHEALFRAARTGEPWSGHIRKKNLLGEEIAVWVRIEQLMDDDGKVSRLVMVVFDETSDTRKAEDLAQAQAARIEALQARLSADAANESKSRFLATISHEIRNPLNAIVNYSALLHEELSDLGATDLVGDVARIETATAHLMTLIGNVLDLSKIEAGKMDLTFEPVDIAALIEALRPIFEGLATQRGNQFVIEIDGAPGTITADALRLRQVLLNLVGNAAKFTDQGEIKVRAYGAANQANIIVSDTGIGIAPGDIERMFEPFEQGRSPGTGGTGIGLTLCRNFLTLMGGTIKVESIEGSGTSIHVTLPREQA